MTSPRDACYPLRTVAPNIWLVVVNWNGAALLPGCLDSLAALRQPARILVVDNGSVDDSSRIAADYAGVEWLPLGRNTGFAAATNVGLRRALAGGARWVGIVNTDVQLDPGWLDALLAVGETHPEAGILGGLLLFADDPQYVNSTGLILDRFGRARDRDFRVPLSALTTTDGPVAGISGGAALFRAEALRRVGLFDPAFFAYYEDVDLGARAARLGVKSWYVSGARALHGFGKSFGDGSPRQRYFLARNHLRFAARHLPFVQAVAVATLFTVGRAGLKAPSELLRGRPAHAWAHLRATGAGALAAAGTLGRRLGGGEVRGVPRGAEVEAGASPSAR